MFTSRKFYGSKEDVPDSWVFMYYLNLKDCSNQKIKSVFNPYDNTPSMFIYKCSKRNKILYKCHSTGKFGDSFQLVQDMFDLSVSDANQKIVSDYIEFCKTGKYVEKPFVSTSSEFLKWSVIDFEKREWCLHDADFWIPYNIGSTLLDKYNVIPLRKFNVGQINTQSGSTSNITEYASNTIYGYFANGELYKIYNPKGKKYKFFLQNPNYIQGTEQLENHNTLLICSSLKDLMAVKSLKLTIDCIAPNSENTRLSTAQIQNYKKKYKHVITCLDSDSAGVNSMQYYNEKYNIPFVYLPREKDISDIIKHHGKDVALLDLYPKLQNAIEKYVKINP